MSRVLRVPSKKPRILYYNGRGACRDNIAHVTERLNLTLTTFHSRFFGEYGMQENRANELIDAGITRVFCSSADVIVVAAKLTSFIHMETGKNADGRHLLQSLLHEKESERCNYMLFFQPWQTISLVNHWHLLMDYYDPEIAPYVYYFSSFEELKAMLTNDKNWDPKNVRVEAPKAYKKIIAKTLRGWADLFGEMGYEVTVDGEKHIQRSGEPAFRADFYDKTSKRPTTEEEWETAYRKLQEWKNSKL